MWQGFFEPSLSSFTLYNCFFWKKTGQNHVSITQERSTYGPTLESMEAEIRRCSVKLKQLKEVCIDAVRQRDETLGELRRLEELLYAYQKRRELELLNMRRMLDSYKEQPTPMKALVIEDAIDKSEENEQLTGDDPTVTDEQGLMASLEDVYKELKSVTGVSNHNDMEKMFVQLENSTTSLRQLSQEAEVKQKSLQDQNDQLKAAYLELKSIGDFKLSKISAHERKQGHMDALIEKKNSMQAELNRLRQQLTYARLAIEHIYVKLQMTPSTTKSAKKQAAVILKHLTEINLPDIMLQCMEYQDQLDNDLDGYDLVSEISNMNLEKSMRLISTE
uniref:GRIP domain-containing protein n=1 Tax=Mesocestoides corti TaxID=53468 RepID=A0A5K3ETB2_MESCO